MVISEINNAVTYTYQALCEPRWKKIKELFVKICQFVIVDRCVSSVAEKHRSILQDKR